MRFERDDKKRLTRVFDHEGKQYYEEHDSSAYFAEEGGIVHNETLAKLEAILREAAVQFPTDREFEFCQSLYCFFTFDVHRSLGGEIRDQQALRDLIKAFDEMDCMDQATLLENYMQQADLRPSHSKQIWLCSSPGSFMQAAENLLIGGRGRGRKSAPDNWFRRRGFEIGYKLFLDLGLKPTIANGGVFGQFMHALWKDPALGELEPLPENIKKLIEEAKKTVEGEVDSGLKPLNAPF